MVKKSQKKVSFNIASDAVTVLTDMLLLIGHKLVENAKIEN